MAEKGAAQVPGPEHRDVARTVIPPHVGAVLSEGRNIAYVWDPYERKLVHGIQEYSVKEYRGRRAWMFENIGAFNNLEAPSAWKGAVDDYLRDLRTAKTNVVRAEPSRQVKMELESQIRETELQMKAMMAVTASARAMERSAANPDLYLTLISQGAEGKPDGDAQDYLKTFLLHKDPEKYYRVIQDPLVKHYYQQVLRDADLPETIEDPEFRSRENNDTDPSNPEWHCFVKVDKDKNDPSDIRRNKTTWFTSRVAIATGEEIENGKIDKIRKEGRRNDQKLIYYLANDAENGGFDAYIRDVLLARDTDEFITRVATDNKEGDAVRWAAARLACDAFLVDKFTRWGFQLTCIDKNGEIQSEGEAHSEKGDGSLKLAPVKDWGGDPFTNVIQPSFLPRNIKRVYEGEAADILDLVDKGFRPDDIFFGETVKFKGVEISLKGLQEKVLHPTATENLKALIRYNKALGLFFGSSRAKDIGEYNMGVLKDSLFEISELFAQIYGEEKIKVGDQEIPIGKHIVGAMMARLVLAKAVAARASMVNPTFFVDVFGPIADPRSPQPLRELREYLFGIGRLDWRSGLIANLSSQRTKFVIRGNMFGAEEDIIAAFNVLATPDEGGFRKLVRGAVAVGSAFAPRK